MSCEPLDERVQTLEGTVTAAFERVYGGQPELIVISPGRVNVIGEHTDYNDGFVLPAAIDRHVVIGLRPRADGRVSVHAADFDDTATFALDSLVRTEQQSWANYVKGVAWALQEEGFALQGFDAALASDVPVASGLSSSAALEVGFAFAFQTLSGFELDGVKRALLCQKAENQFVGMNCGIMDQYIVSLGKAGHVLLIDCRSLDYELAPLPAGVSLVICNTRKKRGLLDSEYNVRRAECERGAATLGVEALRDVTPEQLEARKAELAPVIYRRCRHVVTEDARTLEAVAVMRAGDLQRLGELMNASHVSLRDDYQVSCYELDVMVEAAWKQPGVYGARMTGGGFGGCAVALVADEHAAAFAAQVAPIYRRETGIEGEIYICRADDGVHAL